MMQLSFIKKYAAILVAAFLMVLAAPPLDYWPLALFALVPFLFGLSALSISVAFFHGWFLGILIYAGTSYWWVPLLQDFAQLSLLSSLAISVLLIAYQALVFALWAAVTQWLTLRKSVSIYLAAPLTFLIFESFLPFFFKAHLAITVWKVWPLTQVAEFGGTAAVSGLLVLINTVFCGCIQSYRSMGKVKLAINFSAWPWACCILIFILIFSGVRHYQLLDEQQNAATLEVGVLQPNFGIVSLAERQHRGAYFQSILQQASRRLRDSGVDLLLWPESAWPYLWDRSMQTSFPAGHPWEILEGSTPAILMGTLSHDFGRKSVYNSAVLIDRNRRIVGIYDKQDLLPFAEAIPPWFRYCFPDSVQAVRAAIPEWPDLLSGAGSQVLATKDWTVGVYLCSEDLLPDPHTEINRSKADFLVSLSNDAWFLNKAAALQHFALSSFRAIEHRRPLIRASNTGYSGMFDALGRVQIMGDWTAAINVEKKEPAELLSVTLEIGRLSPYWGQLRPYSAYIAILVVVCTVILNCARRNHLK